jgi:hypothetical protein
VLGAVHGTPYGNFGISVRETGLAQALLSAR